MNSDGRKNLRGVDPKANQLFKAAAAYHGISEAELFNRLVGNVAPRLLDGSARLPDHGETRPLTISNGTQKLRVVGGDNTP